jgi:hypothetical protein
MNEKVSMRDLDDDEFADKPEDDAIAVSSDNKIANTPWPLLLLHSGVNPISTESRGTVRQTVVCCNFKTTSQYILKSLSLVLDPTHQRAREEERSARSLHVTQILMLSNQLCNAQHQLELTCSQLAQAEHERNATECCADCAEMLAIV